MIEKVVFETGRQNAAPFGKGVAFHDTLCPETGYRVQGQKAFGERAATE